MIEATIVFRCDLCGAGSKHEHNLDPWQSLEANGLPEGWHFVDTGWGGRKLVCPRHDVFVDKDRTDGDGRGEDLVVGGVEPEEPAKVEEQDEPPVAQEEPSNVKEIAQDILDAHTLNLAAAKYDGRAALRLLGQMLGAHRFVK